MSEAHERPRPTPGAVAPWAIIGVLLIVSVGLGWWGITMREQQRDLVARLVRMQATTPDRTPPAIVTIGPDTTRVSMPAPAGRWVVLVVHVEAEGEARLELRSGRVSVWTSREPARHGVVVPAALPASLVPPGEYELQVNDRVHLLTVTAGRTK
jgi:hypothetical protein